MTLRIIGTAVFLVWLGVGIRPRIVFSKWTQKYRLYKELQKKLDERLDFERCCGRRKTQAVAGVKSSYPYLDSAPL
ncbi:MAG TPA: hypothetical protein VNI77_05375 [Nitrososphaera sp.]|nr:hypothetical protein [Nitrososphaera sp.]